MPTDNSSQGLRDSVDLVFRFGFYLLVGSIVFSLSGMLLLQLFPSVMVYFGAFFDKLVKTPTWTFMTMLGILPILMYGVSLGWKKMSFYVIWGCVIGGASELIGTTGFLTWNDIALPFGAYEYTQWLGPKMFNHVPYFIPPSWFAMSLVSLDLARRAFSSTWAAVVMGSVFMVLWDVSLDPAMTLGTPVFWTYGAEGVYFGMPLSNWFGWFVISLIIIAGYEYIGGGIPELSEWAPWMYILNCVFPLGLCLLNGLYGPFILGVIATAAPFVIIRYVGNRTPVMSTPAPQKA